MAKRRRDAGFDRTNVWLLLGIIGVCGVIAVCLWLPDSHGSYLGALIDGRCSLWGKSQPDCPGIPVLGRHGFYLMRPDR
jgi:hypothetical protein